MANSIDFISSVYDTLARTVNAAGLSPGFVMQMAWPGYSLSPADFKAAETPSGPYDTDVAREAFSQLSNMVPTANKSFFENSGFEIDDLYELLVSSAIPAVAPGADPMASPLNKLFSDAQFELTQARRGYKGDPNRFYYPCSATPSNWYDEASLPAWSSIDMKATEVKPAQPESPFVRAGGLKLVAGGALRLRPLPADVPALQSGLMQKAQLQGKLATQRFTSLANVGPIKPLNAQLLVANQLRPGAVAIGSRGVPAGLGAAAFQQNLSSARLTLALKTKSLAANSFLQPELQAALGTIKLSPQTFLPEPQVRLPLRSKLILSDLLVQAQPIKPVSPETSNFSVSFKYCRVNIDRPWLKLALLSSPSWCMFNTKAQEYSTGTLDNNPGMFPLLPLSFIAIRDLRITANWSADDRANLGRAASFGFFDLKGGTFNQNTFEVKGLQIVGWISRLTPPLPPMPAP